jgi:CRISPR-associated protein Csx3
MSEIKFDVLEEEEYSIISFEIDGVLSPEDLAALTPPKVDGSKGVILSGRGPIWLYCFLTHFYHPTKFIATYDPRLGGAVIVETHSAEYAIGSVLKCYREDEVELA